MDPSLAEIQKHKQVSIDASGAIKTANRDGSLSTASRIDIYANTFVNLEAIADENEEEYMDEDMEDELGKLHHY